MSGRTYVAKVGLKVVPALEIRLKFEAAPRTYRSVELQEGEFVTDEEDVVSFRAWVHRLDLPEEEAVKDAIISKIWVGEGDTEDPDFKIEFKSDENVPGVYKGTLASSRPLLDLGNTARKLHAEGEVGGKGGAVVPVPRLDMPLHACYLHVSFWVVPGAYQGTSEAGALLCVTPDSSRRVAGADMEIRVDGSTLLSADNAVATTDDDGKAEWTLKWSGLSWDALAQARCTVRCGLRDKNGLVRESVSVDIDVAQNVSGLLGELLSSEGRLRLNNPSMQRGSGVLASVGDWMFPDFCSGPVWNVYCFASHPVDNVFGDEKDPYVCNQIRDRIYEWMASRRLGEAGCDPATMATMNGLEISRYAIAPIHVWAGIHLAGTGADDDPRMLDPWWRQEWHSPAYATADGLITWKGELSRLAGALAASAAMVVVLAKMLAGYSILASAAALKAWLVGGTAGVYVAGAGATSVTVGGYHFLVGADNGHSVVNGKYSAARSWLKDVSARWRHEKRALEPMKVTPW